jgi:hypothetical protein
MRDSLFVIILWSASIVGQLQPHYGTFGPPTLRDVSEKAEPRASDPGLSPPSDDTTAPQAGISHPAITLNWSQTLSEGITAGSQATVTLTPCPLGVDTTSRSGYQVFLSGPGGREAANVVSGSCRSASASGTITFTPYYSYPAGSTIGSASSGIQEMINTACGVDPTSYRNNQCNVTLPANGPQVGSVHSVNTYNVSGTIHLHTNQSVFGGYGVSLDCTGRGPCLQIGDLGNSNHFGNDSVQGFSFRTPVDYSKSPSYAGVVITQTQRSLQVATIVTASAHGFRRGDLVTILFTDNSAYWGDAIVCGPPACDAPTATTFQYQHKGSDIARQTTPGVVALAYEAILDNGMNTHFQDISYDLVGEIGHFNNFFDLWDDENVTIEHFNNNAQSLNANANWTGSFVFSGGNPPGDPPGTGGQQVAPVITLRDSSITANYSNGLTVYNSNGLYVENTVLQATGPWQVYSANSTGNYQGAYLKNIYSESGAQMNPLSPARSPFAGTGVAGLIAGPSTGAATFAIAGSGGTQGQFESGGHGSTSYSYFVVAKDRTAATQTSPLQILNYRSTGGDSITIHWPRVANGTDVITYDLIRIATPIGVGATYPYSGGCAGGSTTTCGSVATNIDQCSGLVCTYADNGARLTNNYKILPGNYAGNLIFWPGSIVTVNRSVAVDSEESNVVGVGLSGNPLQIARQCSFGETSPGGYTSCQASITTDNNSVPNQTATLLTDGSLAGGGMSLSKGRLNFSTTPSAILQPHHIITLIDSQPALTRSTLGYRPAGSANDTWIGTDVPSGGVGLNLGQLGFGAPVSITNYIGGVGDGKARNWKERLTSVNKTFAVPVTIEEGNSFTLGNGSPLSQIKIYRVKAVPASRVPPQSCIDAVVQAIGVTKSDQITGITPAAGLGNLSLNSYPHDADAIILHFCNTSLSPALSPSGTYSFLAIH